MGKVRVHVTMTLDSYMAGPNQSLEKPFGDGMDHIHDWLFKLKSLRELLGIGTGGVTGPSDDVIRETGENLGATIIGRNMFGGGRGAWPEPAWNGWWGENPPYHTPVFVLTHYAREPLVMEGGNVFYFVTDGVEAAYKQAMDAAGEADVRIGGGANVINQFLAAGLIDEIGLQVVPMVLGLEGGARLFDGLSVNPPKLELIRTVPTPEVTHLKYRVQK